MDGCGGVSGRYGAPGRLGTDVGHTIGLGAAGIDMLGGPLWREVLEGGGGRVGAGGTGVDWFDIGVVGGVGVGSYRGIGGIGGPRGERLEGSVGSGARRRGGDVRGRGAGGRRQWEVGARRLHTWSGGGERGVGGGSQAVRGRHGGGRLGERRRRRRRVDGSQRRGGVERVALLQLGAVSSMALAMARAEILAHKRAVAVGKVAAVDLLGRVCW